MTTSVTVAAHIDISCHVLVDEDWLHQHRDDGNVRVVEIDVTPARYDDGHITDAVLWNIYTDLRDPEFHAVDDLAVEDLVQRSGITAESTVVCYGYAAAFGVWLLKLYGHADVRLLNCSRETWQAGGRPWSSTATRTAISAYRLGRPDWRLRADAAGIRAAIDGAGAALVDVRSGEEFRGERFWPSGGMQADGRAGHVPSAIHVPIDGLQDERGAFLDPDMLRARFAGFAVDCQQELITYCTIGARAATAWFVLTHLLGHKHVRVYDGSWAEWGRLPEAPIHTADATVPSTVTETTDTKEIAMPALTRMNLDNPEEVRPFVGGSGELQLVNINAGPVGRATFQPGWRWSEHVKPIALTDSCMAAHTCYFVAGRMTVEMDDGEQVTYGPGDFAIMAPGHDAWIVGDEACVVVDWQGYADYAKSPAPA